MNAPTNIQVLKDAKGKPAFVVIPYAEYLSLSKQHAPTIPNAVVNKVVNKDMTPIRAWREHLGFTQTEVAQRLGISQSAYAQQEAKEPVRKATRENIAKALGIVPEQLAI
jgi:DNA-binding transcriptional regulator YiaG